MPTSDPYQIQIGGVKADPYRIAKAYGIDDPIIFQAIKKLLRCGRKHKSRAQDVREAITSLERWEGIELECSPATEPSPAQQAFIGHVASKSLPEMIDPSLITDCVCECANIYDCTCGFLQIKPPWK